ncbi:MAG: hypothetical protein ACLR7U_11065, partial [Ruthenibacterium lactatiformans]
VRFVRSVTDDLARRDFTVNAMAYSPAAGLIDPFGGAADLAAKRLRCVGEPARRFSEDVLRVLRMARFAATMGFSVEPQTAAAALAKCGALTEVAIERSRAEFCKMLCGRHVARVLRNYRALFEPLLPCLSHVSDAAWENAVSAIQAAPDDLTVRMGLLFCAVEPERRILCPDAKAAEIAAACCADAAAGAPPSFGGGCTLGRKCCGALTLLGGPGRSPRRRRAADDLRDFAAALGGHGYGRVLRPIDAGRERRRRAGGGHSRGGCGRRAGGALEKVIRDAQTAAACVGATCIHGRHGRGQR